MRNSGEVQIQPSAGQQVPRVPQAQEFASLDFGRALTGRRACDLIELVSLRAGDFTAELAGLPL